jgi:hypothetical protein
MCCGNKAVANQQAKSASVKTWQVFDGSGKLVDTKTSRIAAKLAASRIAGGTVVEQTSTS